MVTKRIIPGTYVGSDTEMRIKYTAFKDKGYYILPI